MPIMSSIFSRILVAVDDSGPARDPAVALAADLLVMGSHGRQGVRRFFLGSVAESVVRESPVPVLVVRTAPQPAVHAPAPALSEMSA
jgi:hypothetical protein